MYTQLKNGEWNEMILFGEKFQLRLSVEEEGKWTWRECYEVNYLTDGLLATWMTIVFPACLFDNFLWKLKIKYGHLMTMEQQKKRGGRWIIYQELNCKDLLHKR